MRSYSNFFSSDRFFIAGVDFEKRKAAVAFGAKSPWNRNISAIIIYIDKSHSTGTYQVIWSHCGLYKTLSYRWMFLFCSGCRNVFYSLKFTVELQCIVQVVQRTRAHRHLASRLVNFFAEIIGFVTTHPFQNRGKISIAYAAMQTSKSPVLHVKWLWLSLVSLSLQFACEHILVSLSTEPIAENAATIDHQGAPSKVSTNLLPPPEKNIVCAAVYSPQVLAKTVKQQPGN